MRVNSFDILIISLLTFRDHLICYCTSLFLLTMFPSIWYVFISLMILSLNLSLELCFDFCVLVFVSCNALGYAHNYVMTRRYITGHLWQESRLHETHDPLIHTHLYTYTWHFLTDLSDSGGFPSQSTNNAVLVSSLCLLWIWSSHRTNSQVGADLMHHYGHMTSHRWLSARLQ